MDNSISNPVVKETIIDNLAYNIYDLSHQAFVEYYYTLLNKKSIMAPTFSERCNKFKDIVANDNFINIFFAIYPVLNHILGKFLEDCINMIQEISVNYNLDAAMLEERFGKSFGDIKNMILAIGDKHDGKTVIKVQFEGGELIYKPKSLLSDELYNEILQLMENNQLATFKYIVNYNKETYGWQEVIYNQSSLSYEEAKRYYHRAGIILAIFYLFNSTDMHFENLIAHGEYPVIIDAETLLSATNVLLTSTNKNRHSKSIIYTGMLPICDTVYDINLSGLFTREDTSQIIHYYVLRQGEGKDFYYEKKPALSPIGPNAVYINNEIAQPYQVIKYLIRGFQQAGEFFVNNKTAIEQIVNRNKYKKSKIRCVLRSTQIYYTFIRESKNLECLKSPLTYDKIFNILKNSFDATTFGYLRVDEEIRTLKNLDVPLFYCYADDKNLYSNNIMICENYFLYSPLDNFLNTIDLLDMTMINYQVHLLELILFVFEHKDTDFAESPFKSDGVNVKYNKLEVLENYIDELCSYETFIDTELESTMYIVNIIDQNLRLDSLNSGLYMGGGIVHLIYTAGFNFNRADWVSYSKRLITGLYKNYIQTKTLTTNIPYNVYEGYGGLLYLTYNYSKLFKDLEIKAMYEEILHDILSCYQEGFTVEDKQDYINTISTTIIFLCRVYHDNNTSKETKNSISNLLVEYYKFIQNTSYEDIGFAHGNSGIATVLSFIYAINSNELILDKILKLLIQEDKVINTDIENNTLTYSWCRGLTGILHARCIILDNLCTLLTPTNLLILYLEKAINEYSAIEHLNKMFTLNNICMCHGVAGTIDAFKEIYQITGNPLIKAKLDETNYILTDLTVYQWFKKSTYQLNSFMLGKSGVIYSLLHLMENVNAISINSLGVYN
ncbi:MAG: hypothetical protein ATN33_03690 [Epulopiscium sp. Nele67-Bin001]|nr:MAG: hypothetical protein ATN33_03690 [Epulopiscium sp. Nele67-Bin001]